VRIEVKIFGTKTLDDSVVMLVVDEYGAENGFLGINIVWKSSFETLS
jgi:hypothetical protein